MSGPRVGISAEDEMIMRVPEAFRSDVLLAVRLLGAIPGVRRIWLFGSASGKRAVDWRSDIDIAVEGLPAEMELRIWSELDAALQHPLDLVRCENAPPLLLSEIKKGIRIYEA